VSGRHRVQRPAPRVRVGLVLVPVRLVCRWTSAAWTAVAALCERATEWARARFDDRDPFADVTLTSPQETAPDPIAVLAAPVVEPEEPVQEPLAPADALHALHDQHPNLPGDLLNWRLYYGAVSGEVRSLDVDEDGQRAIVAQYADVFATEVSPHVDGPRVSLVAHGEFAGVRFTVVAVLIEDDTMPLPAYRQAAGTLTTQEISEEVLAEAGVR
jgi:hypothetical protein